MGSKYKLTGCARFFLVMVILAPLAYLGAAYYNGENGIQNIKDFLGIESSAPLERSDETGPAEANTGDLDHQAQENQKEIDRLKVENDKQKERIKELEDELSKLQSEVDNLREAASRNDPGNQENQ